MHIQEGIIPYFLHSKMHIFSHFNISKIKMYLTIVVSQKNGCARTYALKFAKWVSVSWKKIPETVVEHVFKKCCITQTPADLEDNAWWKTSHISDSWSQTNDAQESNSTWRKPQQFNSLRFSSSGAANSDDDKKKERAT